MPDENQKCFRAFWDGIWIGDGLWMAKRIGFAIRKGRGRPQRREWSLLLLLWALIGARRRGPDTRHVIANNCTKHNEGLLDVFMSKLMLADGFGT